MPPDIHHRRSIRLQGYDYAQAGAYFVTICTQNRECLLGRVVDGEMVLNNAGRMVQSVWDGLPGRFPTVELDQFVVMPNHLHGILVLVGAQFIAPSMSGRDKSHPYAFGREQSRPYVTGRDKSRPYIGDTEPGASSQGGINRAPTVGRQIKGVINPAPTGGVINPAPTGGVINPAPTGGVINHAPTLGEIVRAFKAATARQIRLAGLPKFGWQRNYYEHIIRDEKSLNRIREYIATNSLRWELDRENPRRQGEDAFDRWLATFRIRPDKEIV